MSIPIQNIPPESRTSYIIPQLEGERITIPGSKGVFRILASSKQTNGAIAVFQSGAVLSDAPGFHYHNEAHDVFLVTKGFLKLWNGEKCRILGPGDFAYVPPKVIHNPEMIGPHTELVGLIAPGDWVDFFRYVSESYGGIIAPEDDTRNLPSILMPKIMAAKDRFDVVFKRDYTPPDVADWQDSENVLPGSVQPYFLRANTGPKWMAGGILSRPFITSAQSNGKFGITSLESSKDYGHSFLSTPLAFTSVDHCLCVQEGLLLVKLEGAAEGNAVREGETVVIPAGQAFTLQFASKYVRALSFSSGKGLESLVESLGAPFNGAILPDKIQPWDASRLEAVAKEVGVELRG